MRSTNNGTHRAVTGHVLSCATPRCRPAPVPLRHCRSSGPAVQTPAYSVYSLVNEQALLSITITNCGLKLVLNDSEADSSYQITSSRGAPDGYTNKPSVLGGWCRCWTALTPPAQQGAAVVQRLCSDFQRRSQWCIVKWLECGTATIAARLASRPAATGQPALFNTEMNVAGAIPAAIRADGARQP